MLLVNPLRSWNSPPVRYANLLSRGQGGRARVSDLATTQGAEEFFYCALMAMLSLPTHKPLSPMAHLCQAAVQLPAHTSLVQQIAVTWHHVQGNNNQLTPAIR